MPITFSTQYVNLASFPHTDTMVAAIHIDRWDVTKILIDNGSQAEILFLIAFEKMGYNLKQLKEPTKPLYGFSGKESNQFGSSPFPSHSVPHKTLTHSTSLLMSPTCSIHIMPSSKEASSMHLKRPWTQAISASRFQQPMELYAFLAVSKMQGISRRGARSQKHAFSVRRVTTTYAFSMPL
jgi:hypothetical protein